MKHLKPFLIFESSSGLTKEQEEFLDRHTKGTWKVNPDGLVDVHGDFDCSGEGLKDLKGVKFGRVTGYFNCYNNSLESLEGAPREVGEDFYCFHNSLESLEGAPREVGGYFNCYSNSLKTLEGSPREVGGHFNCSHNSLESLEGAPREVGGYFDCSHNSLESLEGAPETIGGKFQSDRLKVPRGQWSTQSLVTMFLKSSGGERDLLGTLISPEALQKRIDSDPERAAIELKSIVNLPEFGDLKWPESLKTEVDLLSDLDSVGL